MNIREFDGDPMVQLKNFENIDDKIFFLNQASVDEINSYSEVIPNPEYNLMYFNNDPALAKLPDFIKMNQDLCMPNISYLFTEGGIDEEGKDFADTWICLESILGREEEGIVSKVACIYASDFQYLAPQIGEEILLKKNLVNVKTL